jgi:hypothetical protein
MGETAITADTYLGMAIPGRLCPNYAHHFTVANGWPTDTTGKKFLAEFQHLPMISFQAQQYDTVEIDLYQTEVSVPPLATREEQTSARHKSNTPRYSYAKVLGKVASTTPTSPAKSLLPVPPNRTAISPLVIPSTNKKYSPSPSGAFRRQPIMQTNSAQRRLDDDLKATAPPAALPVQPPTMDPTMCSILKPNRFDPIKATVHTHEGRAVATDIFMNICSLLAHHSKSRRLMVGGDPLHPDTIIYVREPCNLFRREILNHLPKYATTTTFMPPFLSFMEAMLSPAQIYMNGVYDMKFFTGVFLNSLLSVGAWIWLKTI